MVVICVTGGIATGKSRFMEHFAEAQSFIAVLDCDRVVHEIMAEEGWASLLADVFGKGIQTAEGRIDRAALGRLVFHDAEKRRLLERLLHPEVRRRCHLAREAAQARGGVRIFAMEVPLLYESGFDVPRDYEIVVASSPGTQRDRIRKTRNLGDDVMERILAAQLPIMEKVSRAHIVIWNEGSIPCLKRQALHLRRLLGNSL